MRPCGRERASIATLDRLTEFAQRRQGVSAALPKHKVEALVVTSPANVRYLTGYSGSNGLVVIASGEAYFFTDPRYELEAKSTIDCRVIVARRPLISSVGALVKRRGLSRIGFEPAWCTVEQHEALRKALPRPAALAPVAGVVEELRAVKSDAEIERIRRSVRVLSEAYSRTMRRLRVGVRESDVAAEIEYQMRILGAEKPAFETIVASGARSALPHARATERRIEENDLVLVDMGAVVHGYASDMTRMCYLGRPRRKVRSTYQAVLQAQLAAIAEVRAGVSAARVDAAARRVLKAHGLEKAFVHSTGHGLGLEIHEGPRIARREKTRLQAGMVITVEPGVYLESFGGIRIEDTVLVTGGGCEVLTPTTKELVHF
jgi:Xaa-Pro aminopeptidase